MAILTPDYERMQNGQPQDYDTTKQYRKEFADQDIASAQALITTDNDYLVMDADKLNDLCDTIDYMQQIWEDDKEGFASAYERMCGQVFCDSTIVPPACWMVLFSYDPSKVYNTGDIVEDGDGVYYFCIADNTTGAWDDSKWLRIGNDDVGLEFRYGNIGDLTIGIIIFLDGRFSNLRWLASPFGGIGSTYPNIRYFTSDDAPYTGEIYMGEIYMTDWNGGGS